MYIGGPIIHIVYKYSFEMRVLLAIVLINNAIASNLLYPTLNFLSKRTSRSSAGGECVKVQCKFVCINGNSGTIPDDISDTDKWVCQSIDELHLHDYEFPKNTIPIHFLGTISNRVKKLYIYNSNVEYIETGAFESQSLIEINLKNLNLISIDKGIFKKVSERFVGFSLIQKQKAIQQISENFLDYVKYQIKKLIIQAGLLSVQTLTNSECLLNNLEEVNLSYNSFGRSLYSSSFKQLSVVEILNLTHSEISFLGHNVFFEISSTLRLLDLSHNNFLTISQNIFGWRQPGKRLTINLAENPWKCDCELQQEMRILLKYQTDVVYCNEPMNIPVTSDSLCSNNISCKETSGRINPNDCTGSNNYLSSSSPSSYKSTERDEKITETNTLFTNATFTDDTSKIVTLECHREDKTLSSISLSWEYIEFYVTKIDGLKVQINVVTTLNNNYGVLYFSRTSMQFVDGENNFQGQSMGCYSGVQYLMVIEDLMPDVSYTLCLTPQYSSTLSPFACKSVYIHGNLNVKYNAWLSRKMKPKGIALVILGVVLFQFLGILLVFLLIKQKPTLIKGSRRIAKQKTDSEKIIVFPKKKSLQNFQLMEDLLAKRDLKSLTLRRSSTISMASLESAQSYMSTNIYEVIPSYQSVIPTLSNEAYPNMSYVEIPAKQKRTSNDPLPAIPAPQTSASLLTKASKSVSESPEKNYTQV